MPTLVSHTAPPLVLVHGLWDTPRLFNRLKAALNGRRDPLLIPHLPHRLGFTPLEDLAEMLGGHIEAAFGLDAPVDVLGFSMGGVVARSWIQLMGGHRRVRRFLSVGSPQQGTLVAQPWPRNPMAGIADMKVGSDLLRTLNGDLTPLRQIECCSFFSPFDHMVVPGHRGVLPVGPCQSLPVLLHQHLMTSSRSLQPILTELLRP